MKKIFAVLIALSLVFCLCGCSKDNDDTLKTEHTVDVEYYAKLGKIKECEYQLHSSANDMKEAFDKIDEENAENEDEYGHTHSVYSLMELDDYSLLAYDNANYYYEDTSDDEVFAIVALDTAYDFPIGTLNVEVKSALSKFEAEEKQGNEEIIFFMANPEKYTYIDYQFGNNTVAFIFENNALCATLLADSSILK